jgi:hypothetical protein
MRSFFFLAASALLTSATAADVQQLYLIPDFVDSAVVTTDAATSHYGPPADGCEPDEVAFAINGVPGKVCSPKCTDTPCPTDKPKHVTAVPTCALQNPATGDKYCVLLCVPVAEDESKMLRAVGGGMCGTATCQPIQNTGVCTY